MSQSSANVNSIDAIRAFRIALLKFVDDAANAITTLELEGRRPATWIDTKATYWARENRKASDGMNEARVALDRAEMTTSAEETKYAYDERKALERAKKRMRVTEEKQQAVKRWRPQIHKAVEEFHVALSKFQRYQETDLAQAIASLGRMTESLDRYVQASAPRTDASESREPATSNTPSEGTP